MAKVVMGKFGDKLTPQQLYISAADQAEGAQLAVTVMLDKDNYILTGYSRGSKLKAIGMLEMAKRALITRCEEEDGP